MNHLTKDRKKMLISKQYERTLEVFKKCCELAMNDNEDEAEAVVKKHLSVIQDETTVEIMRANRINRLVRLQAIYPNGEGVNVLLEIEELAEYIDYLVTSYNIRSYDVSIEPISI